MDRELEVSEFVELIKRHPELWNEVEQILNGGSEE